MKPYEVSFKFDAKNAITNIFVNGSYYDCTPEYIQPDEREDWQYQILKNLYTKDVNQELNKLRIENKHLKQIVSVYESINE